MDSRTPSSESSCERAFALASAWMDGTLAGDERKSFGAHLASCRECDAELRARLASRAAGAACEELRNTPASGALPRMARRLGRFRGALLLAC
ncbi:MAG: putative zinc-finger, partial [Planctomycetota bacterium]